MEAFGPDPFLRNNTLPYSPCKNQRRVLKIYRDFVEINVPEDVRKAKKMLKFCAFLLTQS